MIAQCLCRSWCWRKIAHEFIREAISNGELRPDTDGEILIDALYGAIYYRHLLGYTPLTDEYIDTLCFSFPNSKKS